MKANIILYNGKINTLDEKNAVVSALAIKDGKVIAVGDDKTVMEHADSISKKIDLKGKTVIPGINDSHLHLIRGGLNYNLELRWDGVPSLADAMRMLKEQVARTPSPQWVRVVGGWTEYQFAEKRMPTLDEINAVSPDTPVFVLHLYDRAFLNAAALRAVGYDKNTPNPPGGEIQKDAKGNPTGLVLATPNATILYATLGKGPKLSFDEQMNSSRHFMRELNRLGITSVVDAGGGSQNYPDDYQVIEKLNKENQLTVRIAYNLFTQKPKEEFNDFKEWIESVELYKGDDMYRHNGAGEMLVYSAADFEDFLQPRPDLAETMEEELEKVVRLLVMNRWPFRLHATYNESITRFLNVFEKVNREIPFDGLPWIFDHAETIDEKNIDRVKALGGGIAIQHRMAFQGEYFVKRYGAEAAVHTPPVKRIMNTGIPVGGGSDATRVASYNPWLGLYWLASGKTVGGKKIFSDDTILDRNTALSIYTKGSAWFSNDKGKKGEIKVGQLGDVVVLDKDFFTVGEEDIKSIEADMTIVGGAIVYAKGDFSNEAPAPLPVLPDWSPSKTYNGYYPGSNNLSSSKSISMQKKRNAENKAAMQLIHTCIGCCSVHGHNHNAARMSNVPVSNYQAFWGTLGCSCFAF